MSSIHTKRLVLLTSTITAALLASGVVSSPLMTSTMISGGGVIPSAGNIFSLNQVMATTEDGGEPEGGQQDGVGHRGAGAAVGGRRSRLRCRRAVHGGRRAGVGDRHSRRLGGG